MKTATYLTPTVFNGGGKKALALEYHLHTGSADRRTRFGRLHAGEEVDVKRLAKAINESGAQLLTTWKKEAISIIRIKLPTVQAARLFAKVYYK